MFKKAGTKGKKNIREMAQEIKALANDLIQDFGYPISYDEVATLMAVVDYMDKFTLRCLDEDNNVINKIWIGTVLIKTIKVLARSKKPLIKDIVKRIAELEYEIRSASNGKN